MIVAALAATLLAQTEWPVTLVVPPGTTTLRITIQIVAPGRSIPVPQQAASADPCAITEKQALLAASDAPAAPLALPDIPKQGGYYCDPVFERAVMRVSDDNEAVQVVGTLGFSPNNGALATVTAGGGVRIYRLKGNTISTGEDTPANWNAWWISDSEIAYTVGMRIVAYDIAAKTSTTKMDLSELLPGGALQRCSAAFDGATFACSIMQPEGNYPRIGYVVARLGQGVIAKFVNGVDSPSAVVSQIVSGLPLISAYEPGPTAAGGYKVLIDDSGRYLLFSLTGLYNPMAVYDLERKTWAFIQGSGHGDAGAGVWYAMNTAYGTCATSVKQWKLDQLTASTDAASNQGDCLTPSVGWTFSRQYLTAAGRRIVSLLGCASADCGGPYAGEITEVIPGQSTQRRLAKVLFTDGAGYQELQPVLSRDGALLAFTTNLGRANFKAVFLIRMP